MAKLKELYKESIVSKMREQFDYTNDLQVPRLKKVVINMGIGEALRDPDLLDQAVDELSQITGQRPIKTYAKKSIAGFKLRAGMPIGCRVTLRGKRMYEFLDRLFNIALPRVRDFRGLLPNAFDGHGNYTLGITEQIIFPEINYDKVKKIAGMNITIVTDIDKDQEAKVLLGMFGMPLRS